MKLKRKGEYGILGVTYIAQQEKDIVYTREVAESWELPESFLAKIFQRLSKNGILNSYKGVRGGFSLAKSPEEITLKEILDIVQGPTTIGWCEVDNEKCNRFKNCSLSKVLDKVRDNMKNIFENTTIADIAKEKITK
ncbi:MAG TPA: Rrf2 family transcriptional regulator [Nitrospinota bacterium]|nr:Rrf2 family transcriptional regulator [Nitrospinota bacterium]